MSRDAADESGTGARAHEIQRRGWGEGEDAGRAPMVLSRRERRNFVNYSEAL